MFKIQPHSKPANIPRTIRFSENLFAKLQEVSQKKNVSFNALVLQCCQYALDNLEKEETP